MYETILLDLKPGTARLTLNRPQALNSFNEQMHDEVRRALDQVEGDRSLRCLLLTGAGRGFCAGQDLSDRKMLPGTEPPDLGATLERNYNPLIRRIRRLPMPVICAVNGVAAGAGANLALACDLVVAKRSAKFIQAFCKLGLVPDSGGTWFLPHLVGMARATGLALLGDALPAEQAEAWGMIWKSVPDEQFDAEVERLLAHLVIQPTAGFAKIKQALLAAASNTLDQQLDLERDLQRVAGRSADYREGVTAFLTKRTPTFRGE